jgi:mono/diheme cytochrome c family protein
MEEFLVKSKLKIFAIFCLTASICGPAFAQNGADIYKANCQMCHGADGLGATPIGKSLKIVSFKDPSVVKSSNAALEVIIKSGKNPMPSFARKLTDVEIGTVVKYIRTLEK